jgi:hypothetical protein
MTRCSLPLLENFFIKTAVYTLPGLMELGGFGLTGY